MRISFLPQVFFVALVLVGVGCAPLKNLAKPQSERELESGIKSYEEGDYVAASQQLQNSLDLGLDSKHDQGSAHKYLAFIHCASGHEKTCREEFRKAFDADPKFDLQPAESGHPLWGPVFRGVKGEVSGKSKPKSSAVTYSHDSVL